MPGIQGIKKLAILQSSYIPWRGYFDIIRQVDEFMFLDDVQYTRRDWRNRNKIKTDQGLKWLTIPVNSKGNYHAEIREITISDSDWVDTHLKSLSTAYKKAPCYDKVISLVERWYNECFDETFLANINHYLTMQISDYLGLVTKFSHSVNYDSHGAKSDRILSLCLAAGANEYISGPSAKDYLDEKAFDEAGIKVAWMDYSSYAAYPQIHGPFEGGVSILDLLFHQGENSINFIQ